MSLNNPETDKPIPPLWQRIKNLAGSSAEILSHLAKTGEVLADNETQEHRMLKCGDCQDLNSDMVCSNCGCNMKIKWKAAPIMCPLKKWQK